MEGTPLLEIALASTAKIQVHKGSSSSSKTVSLAQAHIVWSFQEVDKTYSIVRKTMPALRRGALKDFHMALDLCEAWPLFEENKTNLTYTNKQTGTLIEFFAVDDAQKARGPRRDRLWCNEGNELTYEDWRQLTMRTRGGICLDYNPSMLRHWIYDEVETRSDCQIVHSSYKKNPFLTLENIREIEIDVPVYALPAAEGGGEYTDWTGTYEGAGILLSGDPFRWAVFGLGRRGVALQAIYPQLFDSEGLTSHRQRRFGLDFGYNHPLSLTEVEYRDRPGRAELHIDQLIHESYLTNADVVDLLPTVGVGRRDLIKADGARPEAIADIKRAGFNIVAADKGPGSVKAGIDKLKTVKLCFTRRSKQAKDQFQDYRWKQTASGLILDEPVKVEDDAPDSVRYAATDLIADRRAPRRRSAQSSLIQ
ncbi:MAG: PBSX family phage terminase large subunit [Janthinobacterium lividum]